MSEILVIGLGNPLMGDDGFGAAVVAELEGRVLPSGARLLDGGTGGLSLLHLWDGTDRVILVDAADMGRPAGSFSHLTKNDLLRLSKDDSVLSLHHAGLAQVLGIGRELGMLPEHLELFAVQAQAAIPGTGLSPPVAATVKRVADLILKGIAGLHGSSGEAGPEGKSLRRVR